MVYWINKMSSKKGTKCKACQAFYRFFRNEFNKFNNTGAQILDSIYHMPLKLIKNCIFGVKHQDFIAFTHSFNGHYNVTLLHL